MPSRQRAAIITPYLTHAVSHHGQVTLIPPDNAGRIRKTKRSRVRPDRNLRPDDEARFNIAPRTPWTQSATANRGRRLGRGRQGRERDGEYNEDHFIPDYPPPSFQEAISSSVVLPMPASTTPCPQFSVNPPPLHIPPSSPPRSQEQPSPVSPSPQPVAENPANSDSESDMSSIEIVELEPSQTEWHEDRTLGLTLDERVKRELHRQRQRVAEAPTPSLSSPLSAPPMKHSHLSPLKPLSLSKPLHERAMSAHPSASPYSFHLSPSQFFRSTTSLRVPLSNLSPPARGENFVSRKLFLSKGKERAITPFEHEPLDSWEVVDEEATTLPPEVTTPLRLTTTLFTRMSRSAATPDTPPNSPSVDHSTSTHESIMHKPVEHRSPRDHKATPPPISFLNRSNRRPPPPPVTVHHPLGLSPTSVRNSPVTRSPSTGLPWPARALKTVRSPPPLITKGRNIAPNSFIPPLSSRADYADESVAFERALEIPLPPTPSDNIPPFDHRVPLAGPTVTTMDQDDMYGSVSGVNPSGSFEEEPPAGPEWEGGSPFTDRYGVELESYGVPYTPRNFESRRAPSPLADGPAVRAGRHYPGRPLPRPPPILPQADVLVNAMTKMEIHSPNEMLVGYGDNRRDASTPELLDKQLIRIQPQVSQSESPSVPNHFQSSPEVHPSPIAPSPPPSPVRDNVSSQVFDPPQPFPPPEVPSPQGAFSSTTDLDVLLSRIGDNQNGSDYDTLLLVSEFVGPATPVHNNAATSFADEKRPTSSLLGKIEVGRRRVTKDGRVKLKLSLLGVAVDRCGICLSQFKDGELAGLGATCQHALHERCLGSWLARSRTCPMCRVPLDPPEP